MGFDVTHLLVEGVQAASVVLSIVVKSGRARMTKAPLDASAKELPRLFLY